MSYLVEPTQDERVPAKAFGYVSEATREAMYDLVVRKFMESGVTQATLAKRLGKSPAHVCRTLGASGNWTIDTVAELLFAIDGSMLKVSHHQPLRAKQTNRTGSMCLSDYHDRVAPLVRMPQESGKTRNLHSPLKLHFEGA